MSAKACIAIIGVVFAVCGCERPKQVDQAGNNAQKLSAKGFSETHFESVTPTADGGAYVVSWQAGLWYMRGPEAIKVRFPDTSTNSNEVLLLEITPLATGGAYAYSIAHKTMWHLVEGTAQIVTEVPSLSSKTHATSISAFPLFVAERQMRLEAERRLEERSTDSE